MYISYCFIDSNRIYCVVDFSALIQHINIFLKYIKSNKIRHKKKKYCEYKYNKLTEKVTKKAKKKDKTYGSLIRRTYCTCK